MVDLSKLPPNARKAYIERAEEARKGRLPKPVVVWSGDVPETCGICKLPIEDVFTDGATRFGPWAFMCRSCHIMYGRGHGTGKGQEYAKQDGQWIKVRG